MALEKNKSLQSVRRILAPVFMDSIGYTKRNMQNVGFTSLEGTGLSAFYITYNAGINPILMTFLLFNCFCAFLPPQDTEACRGTKTGDRRQRCLLSLNVVF